MKILLSAKLSEMETPNGGRNRMPGRFQELFAADVMERLFPPQRADSFFEALYGDVDEGAYDIRLAYAASDENELRFEFRLEQRPGKCLVCNLTYGLPHVFSRHPILNVQGVINGIQERIDGHAQVSGWRLGQTKEKSAALHVIPLIVFLEP
jgi:hypothetical protein